MRPSPPGAGDLARWEASPQDEGRALSGDLLRDGVPGGIPVSPGDGFHYRCMPALEVPQSG